LETKALEWHAIFPDAYGGVKLSRAFPSEPGQVAAGSYYGLCYLASPDERNIRFHLGSEAPIHVWLNAKSVHESTTPTWCTSPGVAGVSLRRGMNKVLVKIRSTASSHNGFYFRTDDSPEDRAVRFAERGLWEEAALLFAKANEKTADPITHYNRLQFDSAMRAAKGKDVQ
jgi:hypothetical protein